MGQKIDGIVRIRRPWSEEIVWIAVTLIAAAIVVFGMGKHGLLAFYAIYGPLYTVYNRRMGVDLGPEAAVIRRPFRRARTLRREEIADVYVHAVGSGQVVAFRDAAGRSVKLTIMNSFGKWGRERVARTHRQIQDWWRANPAEPESAQMPGSASI